MTEDRNYLMVLPVPFHRVDDRHIATESAFANHLRMLLKSLRPAIARITVVAPFLTAEEYATRRAGWTLLDRATDRIEFLPLHAATMGRFTYLLHLPAIALRLWGAVGKAAFVHAGPSALFFPREIIALLVGWLRRRHTIYVVDIDWRASARMNLTTGTWSYGAYWRTRYLHNAWMSLQTRVARRLFRLVMLKGKQMARDYGGGARNVHYILDAAHDSSMVLTAEELRTKQATLARGSGARLRAVYFGRLTPYKGITHMIRAVASARENGANVSLDIYGSGEQLEELQALVRERGIVDAVTMHGAKEYGHQFLREIGDYDLLLACPLSEDTPRSALDAQARGVPVLAYDTYYYRELEQQGAGVECVTWIDVAAIANRLVAHSGDRSRLAELATRGVRFAAANTQEEWLTRRAEWTLTK